MLFVYVYVFYPLKIKSIIIINMMKLIQQGYFQIGEWHIRYQEQTSIQQIARPIVFLAILTYGVLM